jgi:diguanylate cyclase (GGDEF)-like protein
VVKRISLRKLIGTFGMAVAVITAVAVPSGYWLIGTGNMAHDLELKARISATRLARHIYQHDELWRYQAARLVELIEINEADGDLFRQRVIDGSGRVAAEAGPRLDAPVMRQGAPIVVSGATVGHVETEGSLRPLIRRSAVVALLSFALGFSVLLVVRVLPLRILDRTIGELEAAGRALRDANVRLQGQNEDLHRRDEELRKQNERFDAALSNMSQGLFMIDRDERLLVANQRLAEMLTLPSSRFKPGMTLSEMVDMVAAQGIYGGQHAEDVLTELRRIAAEGKTAMRIREWAGRTLSAVYHPLADGGCIATFEDITEQRLAQEKIFYMARHDALTDLPNRLLFREKMEQALNNSRDPVFAALCLDLDQFKGVNDTLGHLIGDQLLRIVADRIRRCIRESDLVARLGADEFAILQCGSAQPEGSTALAQRLLETLSAPYHVENHHVVIGTSIGIAIAPTDANGPDLLLQHADLALHRAKTEGRGTFRYFEAGMDARMQARRVLELDLRRALTNQELEVYYQPIIDVKTETVTGFEALVRWNHPTRGLVSPGEFIPLAEETGLVLPLDEWVLRRACRDAAQWPDHVRIAVNLSAAQFKSRGLTALIVNALTESRLPPNRLELEITESVLLQENEATLAMLNQLRLLGVRISMDDFGTGYSSLSYLRSFPFDKIKIDRSFISELPEKSDSLAIVRAVTGLGRSLSMTTTAEGVETREQFERLKAEGCDEAQGYLFGRPRPLAEAQRLLDRSHPEAAA